MIMCNPAPKPSAAAQFPFSTLFYEFTAMLSLIVGVHTPKCAWHTEIQAFDVSPA